MSDLTEVDCRLNHEELAVMGAAFQYRADAQFAQEMDDNDPLASFRELFLIPRQEGGEECIYLAGNSLGLQPASAKDYINQELEDWARLGVEGHLSARSPWLSYHETLTASSATLVGALPIEVVVMNSLTVNLHLMMVSFYRPTKSRYKILIEGGAFPSDQYAVASQARFHGFDPSQAVIEVSPRPGEYLIAHEDILSTIESEGDRIALILLGDVNFRTGQAFDVPSIVSAARSRGILVGLNLAHGVGNLCLSLHDWGVDFAVWCSYKYLNAGPGAIAGAFVHERWADDCKLPRLAGWWGHDKRSRFDLLPDFSPISGAEGWQLSNPPIFQMAALRASMEIFDRATMPALARKAERLTGYLEYLLGEISNGAYTVITPSDPRQRGSQLSFTSLSDPRKMLDRLKQKGVICDFREPDIIRATPVPLYNRFIEVFRFAEIVSGNERA